MLWPVLGLQRSARPWNRRLLAPLWAMEPVLIVRLARLVPRERPASRFLILSGLAVAGALLAVGAGLDRPGLLLGNGLNLAGVAG